MLAWLNGMYGVFGDLSGVVTFAEASCRNMAPAGYTVLFAATRVRLPSGDTARALLHVAPGKSGIVDTPTP